MAKSTNHNATVSPFSIIILFVAMMVTGLALIPVLDIRYLPGKSLPRIIITFSRTDASPAIMDEISSKTEALLSRISGVRSIESLSSQGSGIVTLELDKNSDIRQKRYEVSAILRQLRNEMPPDMSYPEIHTPADDDDDQVSSAVLVLSLSGNGTTAQIGKIAENYVIPALSKIPGAGEIQLTGVSPDRWEIVFDAMQMENMNLSPQKIGEVIQQMSERTFTGSIQYRPGLTLPVLSTVKSVQPENIGKIPFASHHERLITIGDIAKIIKREKPASSYFRINGKNTVNLTIHSAGRQNQLKLAKRIKKQLSIIRRSLPRDYSLSIITDHTEYIRTELEKIGRRTIFSLAILLVFMLLATASWRILWIVTFSLIANLVISSVFYYLLRVEIHMYSLAGITISFGIIIDNSIIMISHLKSHRGIHIFISLLAATLTTIGALSLVFFLKEHQKIMLIDFTRVIIINLSVSLLVSLFLIPALMKTFYSEKHQKISSIRWRRKIVASGLFYIRMILFQKRYKWVFLTGAVLLFGLPASIIPDGKTESSGNHSVNKILDNALYQNEIRPRLIRLLGGTLRLFTEYVFEGSYYRDPGKSMLIIRGSMPEGCTVHQLNEVFQKLEGYVGQFREVSLFETRVNSYNHSVMYILFTPEAEKSTFPHWLKYQLEGMASALGGVNWSIHGAGKSFSKTLPTDTKSYSIELSGYGYKQLYDYAEQLEKNLQKNPRVENTEINSYSDWNSEMMTEYILTIDKRKMATYHLGFSSYTDALFTHLFRQNLPPVYTNNNLEEAVLMSGNNNSFTQWSLSNQPLKTERGIKKLSLTGKIVSRKTGRTIYRKDQVYVINVNFDYLGLPDQGEKIRQTETEHINRSMMIGYQAREPEYPDYWDQEDKTQYLLLGLVMLIIWFVTAILFESLLLPLAVILLIPISFTGVFLTFYLFDLNFDQGGYASFILLSGLVVNAAIYIIHEYNHLAGKHRENLSARHYVRAFNRKIVAILLTVLSTVSGLVPFMWSGQNEVFWFAFAAGSSGGLLFSLIALLIFLPLFVPTSKKKATNRNLQL